MRAATITAIAIASTGPDCGDVLGRGRPER